MNVSRLPPERLAPLPYHRALCDCLQAEESALWQWFSSDQYSDELIESQKLELLKATVRLQPESYPQLYQLAEQARTALAISQPVRLYQGRSGKANAMLVFFDDEICIVLEGSWIERHSESEILAVLGHEMAHHKLYTEADGRYIIARRLLAWCQQQPDCPLPFAESYRRYQLFTEVYADMGSLVVTGQWQAAISNLIKMGTGVSQVSVEDYLAQADEVLAKHAKGSASHSHPELYLRTQLLHSLYQQLQQPDWQPDNWHRHAQALILGPLDVRSPDLLDQQRLSEATQHMIALILQQYTLPSDALEAMVEGYFPDTALAQTNPDESFKVLAALLTDCHAHTREYFCYLLLDFACADPDLQPESFTLALSLAQQLELYDAFEPVFRKELKKTKADVEKLLPASEPARHES